jgi:TolB-like protein
MKNVLLFFCCTLSSIGFSQNKIPVAVLEFKASGGISADEASILANRFRGILVNTDKFEVVERDQMSTILKEQDFTMSDNCNSQECAVQIGQLLGVKQMIAGSVGKLGQTWTIDLRLIDVEKGKIVQSLSRDHKGEIDGLLEVMKSVAAKFAGLDEKNIPTEKSGGSAGLLNQWEILDGNWSEKDGVLFGSGGHLLYKQSYENYVFEVTVEKLAGPDWAALAVVSRSNIFTGGTKRFRNNTSDIQGYGFNFTFGKKFNLFNGIAGVWYLINPAWKEFQKSDLLNESLNNIRIEAIKDRITIFVNSKELSTINDKTHGYGALCLWVQEPSQIIKFSNIKISPQ